MFKPLKPPAAYRGECLGSQRNVVSMSSFFVEARLQFFRAECLGYILTILDETLPLPKTLDIPSNINIVEFKTYTGVYAVDLVNLPYVSNPF